MSHKSHPRPKPRPDKARPAVQGQSAPRTVKAVVVPAPPEAVPQPPPVKEPPVAAVAPRVPPASPSESVASPAAQPPPLTREPDKVVPPSANVISAPAEGYGTKHITQRTPTPPSELSEMFETLRALFVRDRANGARPDAARCGICYLTFAREELTYHEDAGFYACADCGRALAAGTITMLRRQRR